MAKVFCTTGIDSVTQEGSFMNATLSGHGAIAVSIAVTPKIPDSVLKHGEQAVAGWLQEKLAVLGPEFRVEIQLGPEEE